MFELKECLTLAGKTTLILLAYGTILRVLHRSLRRQRKECGSQSRRTAVLRPAGYAATDARMRAAYLTTASAKEGALGKI